MNQIKNLSKLQIGIFSLLILIIGVLGYLYYDSYKTNIKDSLALKEVKAENLDLSQDVNIVKDKYDKLQKEVEALKTNVKKVSYKKKYTNKKKKLSSAGKKYNKKKVSYKQLYYQLKKNCSTKGYKKSSYNKKKYSTKKSSYKKSRTVNRKYNSEYKPYTKFKNR